MEDFNSRTIPGPNSIVESAAVRVELLDPHTTRVASGEPEKGVRRRVGKGFIALFTMAYLGNFLMVTPPAMVWIPLKVNSLVPPTERAGALGLILGVAAFVGGLLGPVFGKLSDRTTSRWGMRRPWILGGVAAALVGAVIMALAPNLPVLFVGFLVFAMVNAESAALIGVLPDQVPIAQRGLVSGLLGMSLPLGMVGGTFLVQLVAGNFLLVFLLPTAVGSALVVLFALTLKDRRLDPSEKAAWSVRELVSTFWVNPRRNPAYGWAWWSRCLIVLAYAFLTAYQAYYLIEKLGSAAADVPNQIFLGTLLLAGLSILSSVVGGKLSDVTKRRKIFVMASAVIYGIALIVAASATNFSGFLLAMTIAGIGFGAYSAVDLALITDVLPSQSNAAKDMGVFNLANTLPQSFAPAIAPIILAVASGSYTTLFIVAGAFAAISALLIIPVRKVR